MKAAYIILGICFILAAIAAGLYVGVWLCFIGGIVQFVEGVKADPVSGLDIALGILRFVSAFITGVATWFIGTVVGVGFFGLASKR